MENARRPHTDARSSVENQMEMPYFSSAQIVAFEFPIYLYVYDFWRISCRGQIFQHFDAVRWCCVLAGTEIIESDVNAGDVF